MLVDKLTVAGPYLPPVAPPAGDHQPNIHCGHGLCIYLGHMADLLPCNPISYGLSHKPTLLRPSARVCDLWHCSHQGVGERYRNTLKYAGFIHWGVILGL